MSETTATKKTIWFLLIGTIILVAMILGLMYLSNRPTVDEMVSEVESEPLSTLVCANAGGKEALEEVRLAYDQSGDSNAFTVAEKHINAGTCEYSIKNNLFWWQQGHAPEGFEEFEEVSCLELSNGHCLSVQPIYEYDEENEVVVGTGYMLVEPRTSHHPPPERTTAARSRKGLIFDMNY